MRLTCPQCGAQYEVPESALPAEGRDVECSNCGTTWFQARPAALSLTDPVGTADRPGVPPSSAPLQTGTPETPVPPEQAEPEEVPLEAPTRPRRKIDPAVLDVLREEAAFSARRPPLETPTPQAAPDTGPETGPETGPDPVVTASIPGSISASDTAPATPAYPATARSERRDPHANPAGGTASLHADPAEAASAAAPRSPAAPVPAALPAAAARDPHAGHTSRRDLLPDVEQINSSLAPSAEAEPCLAEDGAAEHAQARRGFWLGVLVPVVIVLLAVLLYFGANGISRALPVTSPALQSYAGGIDSLRAELAEILSRVQTAH